ncbi:hypothetical protein OBBRIDRAFT_797579 [Obba rivulosa]|uniref:Uncharacterized protein n=1 Tax=Obba rivulosa TaxID=1052685 RepID=A0A8E2AQ26_9APHY|nr:hypothetical protein OBBRIDRAFT_797579 [Obba rivulosa]
MSGATAGGMDNRESMLRGHEDEGVATMCDGAGQEYCVSIMAAGIEQMWRQR